ncbi:hypothetical protein C0995_013492 [Termitomyces sp. Mi166|nr:hypothetical protein C0995_013492 [Termitomyces sp. Mi166\
MSTPDLSLPLTILLEGTRKAHETVGSSPGAVALLSGLPREEYQLAQSSDPLPLLAYAYVRYMGDLSGGQTIRRTIGKAYGFDEASGEGLLFYAFKELKTTKPATQDKTKCIKEWFRDSMNKAGG